MGSAPRARVRVGLSGWSYGSWRGDFYPADLPRSRELEYASRRFPSIEINSSFHALQSPTTYRRWHGSVPEGFVFAVKGSRYITHRRRLREVEAPLANFFASGVLALEEKLGPFVWQLPPSFPFDPERLEAFLELLPRDTEAAAALARGHDERLAGRAHVTTSGRRRLRHALEVRHGRWLVPELVRIARRQGVALVTSHGATWPLTEELTAGFAYVRLHGAPVTYSSRYGDRALDRWARAIRSWRDGGEPEDAARITTRPPPRRAGRDVYVYFDNDAAGHAPKDALRLARRLAGRGA